MRMTYGRRETLGHVARDLCIDEKTATRIRNEQTLAKATTFIGMFLQDPELRAQMLALAGERAVPVGAAALAADALPVTAGLTHHLALVQSPTSDGGAEITDDELVAGRAIIERSHACTSAMLNRLVQISKQGQISNKGRAA